MNMDKNIEQLIDLAIVEDIGKGDITSQACIPNEAQITVKVVLKQAGVLAALPYLSVIFHKINPSIEVKLHVQEGSFHKAGTLIATITGPARDILTGERIALNLIQHASGVATLTASYVKKVVGYGCAILDTRKTLPGLRNLEKYAVRVGGGINHRFGLDDRFIIKINHLAVLSKQTKNPISEAIKRARAYHSGHTIEIEIDDIEFLDEALKTEARVIILCNMTPDEVATSVKKIRKTDKKVYIQSTTITLDTIRSYAEKGVDAISIGILTHSVPALDIAMKM
jgi:nicotinate-nucleotide pyrophosphorylase (carboxylating)